MSSNFLSQNLFFNNKRNNDSRLLSTKSSSIKSRDICVLDKSSSAENKKEVTQSKAGSDFSNQSTGVENFSNQNTTDNALKAYDAALSFIETSNYHVGDYTKSRDKCFFFLYAMTKKPLTDLTRMRVKELNNMIAKFETESNQLKVIDSDGQEQTVDLSKYNLNKDFQKILEEKKENDFVLTEYRKKDSMHRITLSRRLHRVLDQVSQHLDVPKEKLEFPKFDLSRLDLSK
jgi:hypothetical protein